MMPGRRQLLALLLVCIAVRLLFFGLYQPWLPSVEEETVLVRDALGYHGLATTLLETGRFAYTPQHPPDSLRTPAYPALVAAVYALAGPRPWVVMLLQIAMDAAACALLVLALARLFDRRVALIAGAFYALDPFLIFYASTLLSDTFFVLLLVGALYAFSRGVTTESGRGRIVAFGAMGLLLGLATLTRPVAQYLPLLFAGYLAIRYRRKAKNAVRYAGVTLAVFGLALLPWLLRNYAIFRAFSLSTSGGYNLLVLNVGPMEMAARGQDSETVRLALLEEADEMIRAEGYEPLELSAFQRAGYFRRLALQYIAKDPTGFARVYASGALHTFTNLGTSAFARVLRLPVAQVNMKVYGSPWELLKAFVEAKGIGGILLGGVIAAYLLVSYGAATAGIAVSWRRYRADYLALFGLVALYFVAVTGAGGESRFRLPAIPFYLPFTAIGMVWLRDRIAPRRQES